MNKRLYQAPILLKLDNGGAGSETGQGSGQGTMAPDKITYSEWWNEIAWGGNNPDADYNGDGKVDENDYNYYMTNKLYNG